MMRTTAVAAALVALLWVAVPAQVATGRLSGQITLAGTGRPVEGAQVTLNGTELRVGQSAVTDDDGQFAFTQLPAGSFTVRATLPGHIAGAWGQQAPGRQGTVIVLGAGQQRTDISFEIAKGGVISGLVLDEKNRVWHHR